MSDHPGCTGVSRRTFLADAGMGFTGLVLGAMLHRDGVVRADTAGAPDGKPHFPPKAKNVIWLFMIGGTSHVETFDPKPELTRFAGKTYKQTPYPEVVDSPYLKKNLREFLEGNHKVQPVIYPLQVGYRKRGQSGLEISDWWPHVGGCADDLALVRSMWTTDNDHGAQLQFHTGRHALEGVFPTIGSWVHYGLGSLNDDLPQFVVIGTPIADCCGGVGGHGAAYLGPEHDGVALAVDPKNPLPFARPGADVSDAEQRGEFALLNRLNTLSAVKYPDDPALRARIKSYELAFRMQTAVPEVVKFSSEPEPTRRLYGLDNPVTRTFGEQCLAARRLVERGVRFVQIFHGSNGGAGAWDAHSQLRQGHSALCAQVDQPIAALLKDLKQRGLLDETLVVWATEFGRTPGGQGGDGRDHHPYGFSVWLAGGGIKGGVAHGATDPLGFHAVESRHYVTDIHATVLHQLGLDPRRLEVPGQKRLEIDFGKPIREIIAERWDARPQRPAPCGTLVTMATHLNVFLLTVGHGRRLFYSEVVEPPDDAGAPDQPRGLRGWLEMKLHRMKNGWQHSQGTAVRLSRQAWEWLHSRTHPDETLYARLRSARSLELRHPTRLATGAVAAEWSGFLARGRRRHWPWLVVNTCVAPFTVVLAPLPGPNLIGYWFVYRAIHHLFILHGLSRVRAGKVAVRFLPVEALDRPDSETDPEDALERLVALGCDPAELQEFLTRQGVSCASQPDPAGGGAP